MTDKEIFERFASWTGMLVDKQMDFNGSKIISYTDIYDQEDRRFTTIGDAGIGAIFDENGKIIIAYFDTHEANSSGNARIIKYILEGYENVEFKDNSIIITNNAYYDLIHKFWYFRQSYMGFTNEWEIIEHTKFNENGDPIEGIAQRILKIK